MKVWRRGLAVCISVAMLLTFYIPEPIMMKVYADETEYWTDAADSSWYTGHEKDSEYVISTAEGLAGLAVLCNSNAVKNDFSKKTIKLGADIDLKGKRWVPIGNYISYRSFNGDFDGQGHTISNLTIVKEKDKNDGMYQGLFGYCVSTMSNVTLTDVSISVSDNSTGVYRSAGALCGNLESTGTVKNVIVKGFECTFLKTQGVNNVGGIIGDMSGYKQAENDINFSNCSVSGFKVPRTQVSENNISSKSSTTGGLAGQLTAGSITMAEDCSVFDSDLSAINALGGLFGDVHVGGDGSTGVFRDCRIENMSFTTTFNQHGILIGSTGMDRAVNINCETSNCKNGTGEPVPLFGQSYASQHGVTQEKESGSFYTQSNMPLDALMPLLKDGDTVYMGGDRAFIGTNVLKINKSISVYGKDSEHYKNDYAYPDNQKTYICEATRVNVEAGHSVLIEGIEFNSVNAILLGKDSKLILKNCTFTTASKIQVTKGENAELLFEEDNFGSDFLVPSNTELICGVIQTGETTLPITYEGGNEDYAVVTYVYNDEAGNIRKQIIKNGATAKMPVSPQKEGEAFVGWLTADGDIFDFSRIMTADTILNASWDSSSTELYVDEAGAGGLEDGTQENPFRSFTAAAVYLNEHAELLNPAIILCSDVNISPVSTVAFKNAVTILSDGETRRTICSTTYGGIEAWKSITLGCEEEAYSQITLTSPQNTYNAVQIHANQRFTMYDGVKIESTVNSNKQSSLYVYGGTIFHVQTVSYPVTLNLAGNSRISKIRWTEDSVLNLLGDLTGDYPNVTLNLSKTGVAGHEIVFNGKEYLDNSYYRIAVDDSWGQWVVDDTGYLKPGVKISCYLSTGRDYFYWTVCPGDANTYVPDPEKEDYIFTGWYSAKTGGKLIDFSKVSGTYVGAYARFEEVQPSVTILQSGKQVTSTAVKVGGKITLTADTVPKKSTVVWEIDSEDCVSMTEQSDGSVTVEGLVAGSAILKASITTSDKDTLTASCSIRVEEEVREPELTAIEITPSKVTLKEGEETTLSVVASPSDAAISINWSSNKPEVASVDAEGMVTAHKAGTATVTATAGNLKAACLVTVKAVSLDALEITPNEQEIVEGESEELALVASPSDAEYGAVQWSSSKPAVASVSSGGLVKGIKAGTTVITAKAGGQTATCRVTVISAAESYEILLVTDSYTLTEGKIWSIAYDIFPTEENVRLKWKSYQPSVAVVDSHGSVTAKMPRTATIEARIDGTDVTAQCEITVEKMNKLSVDNVTDALKSEEVQSVLNSKDKEQLTESQVRAAVDSFLSNLPHVSCAAELYSNIKAAQLLLDTSKELEDIMLKKDTRIQPSKVEVDEQVSALFGKDPVSAVAVYGAALNISRQLGEGEVGGATLRMTTPENPMKIPDKISNNNIDTESAVLIDMKLLDASDDMMEDLMVPVRIVQPLPKGFYNSDHIVVLHYASDGTIDVLPALVEHGKLSFVVTQFSTFAIVKTEKAMTPIPDSTTDEGAGDNVPEVQPASRESDEDAVTGQWLSDTIGWWYCYTGGTWPSSQWAYLPYQGRSSWYYFDERGYMKDGWLKLGEDMYFLHNISDGSRGYMYTGWHTIDGNWYYFEAADGKDSGKLYRDDKTPDGYQVDDTGIWKNY